MATIFKRYKCFLCNKKKVVYKVIKTTHPKTTNELVLCNDCAIGMKLWLNKIDLLEKMASRKKRLNYTLVKRIQRDPTPTSSELKSVRLDEPLLNIDIHKFDKD
jgi:hypothetical protein